MAVALLSVVGVFVAAYLYLYKIGRIGSMACGTGGCETVQLSRWSTFLGVEVSLIGLGGFLAILVLALAGLQPSSLGRRGPAALLALTSGIGTAFAGYLTYLELFVIHAICQWCVVSAVIITAIFVVTLFDLRASTPRGTPETTSAPSQA